MIVEASKRLAEVLSLAEDRQPTEASLKTLEADLLEEPRVVMDRPAPLGVVIGGIVRGAGPPPATRAPVIA
jgi:hypothetical protein